MKRIFKILEKDRVGIEDYIYFVLEACATSCQFGSIYEHEHKGIFSTRGNINVYLRMPLGSGKTTSIIDIKNSVYENRLTYPSLVGTITKNGTWVEGAILRSAGKVLILDEFTGISNDVKEALNNLLEQRVHSRSLGYSINGTIRRRGRFLRLLVKKNTIELKVRFSCIASSVFKPEDTGVDLAWFTRFIPINFIPPIEYFERLTAGEVMFKVNPKPVDTNFIFRDYVKAHEYYWSKIKSKPYFSFFKRNIFHRGYLARVLQDLVRLSAFVTSLKKRKVIPLDTFEIVCDKLIDQMFWNYISSGLTSDTLKVLMSYSDNKPIRQIAFETGFSKSKVHRIVKKLQEKDLLPFVVG